MAESQMKVMSGAAVAAVGLATATLVGIAVITGFKDSGTVDNTTADNFIAGLAIFGTFMSVIALTLVGKIIIGLVRSK